MFILNSIALLIIITMVYVIGGAYNTY
jgi:hypothetical protein